MSIYASVGKAQSVPVPATSVSAMYPGADLLDAFAVALPADASDDVATLALAALGQPRGWIRILLAVRDLAMSAVGVKSTSELRDEAMSRGDVVGFFPVLAKHETEIVLGADDRHLDFRVIVLLRTRPDGRRELLAVTIVHCKNLLGRIYLATITPFHRAVVRANLEQVVA